MIALSAALIACLTLPQQAERDVIIRKDGRSHSGRILSEAGDRIVFEIIITGSKGQTIGTGKLTIPKTDIDRIKRASSEGRKKASARSEAFNNRSMRMLEAMAKIKPVAIRLEGAAGYEVSGSHFRLRSTCDEAFVKDAAYALEEVFAAYRRYFDVRRNAEKKVDVYLFADRTEYNRFQQKQHGGVLPNAAYFDPKGNYIAGFNLIQKDEERRIRREMRVREREIMAFGSKLTAEERRVEKLAKDLRKELLDAVTKAKNLVRGDGQGRKAERLREIDQIRDTKLMQLDRQEVAARKELAAYRASATKAIENNRKVVERNRKTLRLQNRSMYELLFHEGFHAFATTFLWKESSRAEFPRWLHEGMASYFEMSVVEAGELIHGGAHPNFKKVFQEVLGGNPRGWLKRIVSAGPEIFMVSHVHGTGRATVSYAQSWALSHYLAGRVSRERLAKYVDSVLAGAERLQAFEKMMGKPCADVERDVERHVRDLK